MHPLAPGLIQLFPTWMVSSSRQYSRTLSVSKTWSGLYWQSSSMNCSVMQGGRCSRSWLMPSLEYNRNKRLKSNSSPEIWLGRRVSYSIVHCILSLIQKFKKSGFKRKMMLFLQVSGARDLSAAISFVPQHILLMPQYKLNSQKTPVKKETSTDPSPATPWQWGTKNLPHFFNETLWSECSVQTLIVCVLQTCSACVWRNVLLLFAYCSWNSSLTSFTIF